MIVDGEEFDIINHLEQKTYNLNAERNYRLHNKRINEQKGVRFSFVRPKRKSREGCNRSGVLVDAAKFKKIIDKAREEVTPIESLS